MVAPGEVQECLPHHDIGSHVIYVPEIVGIDLDDTQTQKKLNINHLIHTLMISGAPIDTDELRHLCETTPGFSPYAHIYEVLGDQADEALRGFRSPTNTVAFPDAAPLRQRLDEGEVPNFTLTYGTSVEYQYDKQAGPGAPVVRQGIGMMIVPKAVKYPFMQATEFDDGYHAQHVLEPRLHIVAKTAVLIDDKEEAFEGWIGKGFRLDRNATRPSGERIVDADKDYPKELINIHSLDELVTVDQQLVHRNSSEAQRAIPSKTERIFSRFFTERADVGVGVIPTLNPEIPVAVGVTVCRAFIR